MGGSSQELIVAVSGPQRAKEEESDQLQRSSQISRPTRAMGMWWSSWLAVDMLVGCYNTVTWPQFTFPDVRKSALQPTQPSS